MEGVGGIQVRPGAHENNRKGMWLLCPSLIEPTFFSPMEIWTFSLLQMRWNHISCPRTVSSLLIIRLLLLEDALLMRPSSGPVLRETGPDASMSLRHLYSLKLALRIRAASHGPDLIDLGAKLAKT